jgi:hypothetical protein
MFQLLANMKLNRYDAANRRNKILIKNQLSIPSSQQRILAEFNLN